MKIKKSVFLGLLFIIGFIFVSCDNISFNGSRTGNSSQFIVDFDVLNTTKSHTMTLSEGERIKVIIEKEKGDLKVYIYDSNHKYSYRSDNAFNSSFVVSIDHTDTYTFEIVGENNSKGKVEFKKID